LAYYLATVAGLFREKIFTKHLFSIRVWLFYPGDSKANKASNYIFMMKKVICLAIFLSPFLFAFSQQSAGRGKKDTTVVDTLRPEAFKVAGKPITGNASVYDLDFDGSKTASGETFFNIRLTAASDDFDLNSWVKVTNPKNKKYTIVRINDKLSSRQKKKGIKINLSQEASKELGIKKESLFKVKLELISINDSSFYEGRIYSDVISDVIPSTDSLTPNSFEAIGKSVNGIASFYSYKLDGTITATGERYRNAKLTAASNNFKLNTWVLVTNLKNKKSVIVRINDRMHPRMKKKGRVVDLSREAARQLAFMDNGLAKVKVQPIKFVFSPEVKQQLDSAKAAGDSAKPATDSVAMPPEEDASVTGIASFYSTNLDGTKTATGERYRNNKLSAASNHFDLNTWVRVTNLRNNKSVILRINDRMHPRMKAKGRVVDLSRVAAKKLDFIDSGLTRVKVEPVEKGTVN
jgi:rare lipoprotein A (peptidoglycan hydrolase)